MFAENVWKQARKKGLTGALPVDAEQVAKRAEILDESRLGCALFELCAAAQQVGLNPEDALRRYTTQLVAQAEAVHAAAVNNAHAGKPENEA